MLPETAEKLYALINDGATVIGNAPQGPATLIGGKKARKRLDTAAAKIWGNSAPGIRNVGKGRIVAETTGDRTGRKCAGSPVAAPDDRPGRLVLRLRAQGKRFPGDGGLPV